ncbi:hypothetical protein ECE50_004000 [Chitinophaga sp. Mgbs1]|uniref:Uncharacterized protein n=1 Tax=Chitinophaga solisilvae TaxID=1233460 RepID=A0A433W9E4_9BACT|nr:hypothetical protein [Chitinophaga solisilvae]
MLEDGRPNFVKETEKIYKEFESQINMIRQGTPMKPADINLSELIKSAYVKTYDFMMYLCQLRDLKHAFFQLPMLRGICEDLITLSYIKNQSIEIQNYILAKKRFDEMKKSSKAQKDFFDKYNPKQIIPPLINNTSFENILSVYRNSGLVLQEATLPKVFEMAKLTGLADLYQFLYHATSKAVHFDIFTLLSTGWGEIDRENETLMPNFSYQHDYKHYFTFTFFYCSYLFIKQTKAFSPTLQLANVVNEVVDALENIYKDLDWPELITFHHLNIEPPPQEIRTTYRTGFK